MLKTLNFNCNYNGKLFLRYFTTIRSLDTVREKDLKSGDFVEVQLQHLSKFQAEVIDIFEINLSDLSDSQKTLLMLDCGCHWSKATRIIAQLCKSNKVAVITLSKFT